MRVNAAYARAGGHEPAYYAGRSHFVLFPSAENEAIFRRVLETGEPYAARGAPYWGATGRGRGATLWDWDLYPIGGAGPAGLALFVTESSTARLRRVLRGVRNLAGRLDRLRETESLRVSREIHKELGGILASLKIELATLPGDPALDTYASVTRLADEAIAAARRIARDLRPAELDDFGLMPAVTRLIEEFRTRTKLPCPLAVADDEGRLPTLDRRVEAVLYRILEEALANAARHAGASSVKVGLAVLGDEVLLTVADDGVGLPRRALRDPGSLGLIGMRERAISVGGFLHVGSGKPKGTAIAVHAPIKPRGTEG